MQNTKIIENFRKTFTVLIFFIFIAFTGSIFLNLKDQISRPELNKLVNSLYYLEVRLNGVKSKTKIDSIEGLKNLLLQDDYVVEDLRTRGIISKYSLYNDLKAFRNSEKLSGTKTNFWIDYSKNTLKGNVYEVIVSEPICDSINRRLNSEVSCNNNIAKIIIK